MLKFLFLAVGLAHAVTEADEAAIGATKQELLDGLKKLSAGDAARAVLLKSASKSISKLGTSLTPDEDATLTNVSNLLDLVLTEFEDEATLRSGYVSDLIAEMAGCDSLFDSNLTTQTSTVDTAFNTHTICRVGHAVAYQKKVLEHNRLRNMQTNTHTVAYTRTAGLPTESFSSADYNLAQACTMPAADESKIHDGAWEIFIEATNKWFTDIETVFITFANNYITAYTEEQANRTQCDSDQQTYESEACALDTLYSSVCTARASCWSNANSSNTHGALQDFKDDNVRVPLLVQIIRYIKCIIAEIQKNVTTTTTAARTTCAHIMSEDTANTNSVYTPYYVNTSELTSNSWPTAADCEQAQTNDMAEWIPFSKDQGVSHGYYENVTNHGDWVYNATLDNTFWTIITPGGACSGR